VDKRVDDLKAVREKNVEGDGLWFRYFDELISILPRKDLVRLRKRFRKLGNDLMVEVLSDILHERKRHK